MADAAAAAEDLHRDIAIPSSWLQRASCKRHLPDKVRTGRGRVSAAPPPLADEAVKPWLAKLRTECHLAELHRCAARHRSADAEETRQALRKARVVQDVEAHCHAAVEFLRGPRQLRDHFGSVLDGTDRTADAILEGVADLRNAMLADVANLCCKSREARMWGKDTARDESALPSNKVRWEVLEATLESDRLLERCGLKVEPDGEHCSAAWLGPAPPDATPRVQEAEDRIERLLALCEARARCVDPSASSAIPSAGCHGGGAHLEEGDDGRQHSNVGCRRPADTASDADSVASGSVTPVGSFRAREEALEALKESERLLARAVVMGHCEDFRLAVNDSWDACSNLNSTLDADN